MVDRRQVVIVGAGPAGLLTALNLREVEALVIEASTRPGWPPHCTGLVSPATARRFNIPEAVTEAYNEAVFLDDRLQEICRVSGSPLAVRLSRPILEELLAQRVESLGHRIAYRARADVLHADGCVQLHDGRRVCGEWVVAALGANPRAAAVFGARNCRYLPGFEVRVRLTARVSEDAFYTIHGWRVAPQFFAWVVPLRGGREALIGVGGDHAVERLAALMQRLDRMGVVHVSSIVSHRGGRIVEGPPAQHPLAGKLAGIGDVLCASKPFTGGGLYAISILAKPLAVLLEKGEKRLLLGTWARLRRELEVQYLLTRAARLLQPLWRRALTVACSAAASGRCSIDYDAHSSLVECLAPWRGASRHG